MALLASKASQESPAATSNQFPPNKLPAAKREIAAPNQKPNAKTQSKGAAQVTASSYLPGRNNFPNLLPFNEIRKIRKQYVGPTNESNWVLPGHLLVGAYPGVVDDEENM